jgi:hypothetical protein
MDSYSLLSCKNHSAICATTVSYRKATLKSQRMLYSPQMLIADAGKRQSGAAAARLIVGPKQPFHILRDDVDFKVHPSADLCPAEGGEVQRGGNQ